MTSSDQQPNWQARMPGEQWVMLDSPDTAEAYLNTYADSNAVIQREPFPNPEQLYARVRFPGQFSQHHIYISPRENP